MSTRVYAKIAHQWQCNKFALLLEIILCSIHQSGKWYTNENIDQMLMERHLNKKARRSSQKNHIKGPRKRTDADDERFFQSMEKMVLMAMKNCSEDTERGQKA